MQWRLKFVLLVLVLLALGLPAMARDIPRPEHPLPIAERAEWLNLNGPWEFWETQDDNAEPTTFPDEIIVPFARESKLSGLERTEAVRNVWYRRTFTMPAWKSPRQRLHIMAADFRTRVWVNGTLVATAIGGNTPITADITAALRAGENEIKVHCFDDAEGGLQPLGKQTRKGGSQGIFYTRTTGIWQTVWLEGVGSTYLRDFRVRADANGFFEVVAEPEFVQPDMTLRVSIRDIQGESNFNSNPLTAPLTVQGQFMNVRPWSSRDPHLYDLTLQLVRSGQVLDEVNSYIGFRTVSIQGPRILINGEPVFQRLVLDQGFYPDGVWTAPSDEALRNDIKLAQDVGFNGARLHQKVFEPRFLYHAAKMGYLCWGEYPSYGPDYDNPALNRVWVDEWTRVMQRDRNQTAVIGWCPFNETPREAIPLQGTIYRMTRLADSGRPAIETSGWSHGLSDPSILDAHDYEQDPAVFRRRWQGHNSKPNDLPARYLGRQSNWIPFMVSEYGGIGWNTGEGWGYGNPPKTQEEYFTRLRGLTLALLDNPNHFGFVYTQLTDVEQEKNGVYTYDRKPKFEARLFREIFGARAAYEQAEFPAWQPAMDDWRVLVGSAVDTDHEWDILLTPPAHEWTNGFKGERAKGGFGRKEGFEDLIRTPWTTADIYLSRTFEVTSVPAEARLVLHYDNATKVWINGNLVWESPAGAWNDGYQAFELNAAARAALKTGTNTIVVHCHQDSGGQFIDLALLGR